MNASGNCDECRFWQEVKEDLGECRRNAPIPRREDEDEDGYRIGYRAQWPLVMAHEWCGQFEPKVSQP